MIGKFMMDKLGSATWCIDRPLGTFVDLKRSVRMEIIL